MSFRVLMKQNENALRALRAKTGAHAARIVLIYNDPTRRFPGREITEIGGLEYERGEHEDEAAYYARLEQTAALAGHTGNICVSMPDDGPCLADYEDEDADPTKTIEISGLTDSPKPNDAKRPEPCQPTTKPLP
jgi:hypothetical protein